MKIRHLVAAGCLAAAPFVLLAPGQAPDSKKAPFLGRNFAHRGLHSEDQSVPENSLKAFSLAAEAGYGMELDVQLSRDGQVVVFHDDTLDRACGVASRVDELDYDELKTLSLFGTEERIPLFSEVLALVDGRTPLIVELKTGHRNDELCEKTWEMLRTYPGAYCIESFHPLIVAWFRFHAPTVLRGQLAQLPEEYVRGGRKIAEAVVLGNTLLNAAARPQFIAYRIGPKPLAVRFAEALGAMAFGWTSHSRDSEAGRDAVIFEYYRPDVRFK
jgi:glycerophosphoryl diester phosphodiesterase